MATDECGEAALPMEMHVTVDAPSSAFAPLLETLRAELSAALGGFVPLVKPLISMGGPGLRGGVAHIQPLTALPGGLGLLGGAILNTNTGNALPLGAVNPLINPAGAYKPPSAYYPTMPRSERSPELPTHPSGWQPR